MLLAIRRASSSISTLAIGDRSIRAISPKMSPSASVLITLRYRPRRIAQPFAMLEAAQPIARVRVRVR